MDNNELKENEGLPPFHHESRDVGAACGINIDREGGITYAAKSIRKYLKQHCSGDGITTSEVVEAIEKHTNLNSREIILLCLMMGQAKGVADAPEVLARMIHEIEKAKGDSHDDLSFNDML